MVRRILLLFLLAAIFAAGGALGEVKTFSREMRRVIGENQSRDDARAAAVAEAKRQALEEAGTYLETLTVVKNFQVARDDMLALAAGVTRSRVVVEEPFLEGSAFGIRVVVAVSVDTATLDERIKKLLADRRHLADRKASQKRVAELLQRVAALEEKVKRLAAGGTRQEKEALQAEFRENTRNLTAQEWFQKGLALWKGRAYESPQQAVQFFSKAIELDPDLSLAYNNRGIAYIKLKQAWRDIEDFDRAIQLYPGLAPAYSNRGLAYHKLKQFRRAIADHERTIELDPRYALAYNNRGLAYHKLKQFRRAIEDYGRAIELDPGLSLAYNNRGLAYSDLQHIRSAIEDYDRAIELDPDIAEAYTNRGNAYYGLKQTRRAIADHDRAIQLYPGFALAYINRGIAYASLKQFRRAIEDYDSAIELDPSDATPYYNRGHAYINLKQYRRAIEDHDRAIELDPDLAKAYANRGVAYGLLGKRDQACRDLRKACELGNTSTCEGLRKTKPC